MLNASDDLAVDPPSLVFPANTNSTAERASFPELPMKNLMQSHKLSKVAEFSSRISATEPSHFEPGRETAQTLKVDDSQ